MMNFIMEHVSVFIGSGVVLLLAIIGYFADKKDNARRDKEQSKVNDQFVNDAIGDSNSYASPISFNELPDVSGVNELDSLNNYNDVSQPIDSSDDNEQIVEDVIEIEDNTKENNIDFGFSNFEDINMSLEDLEKKNYEKLVNQSDSNVDGDNFYYSNIDNNSSEVSEGYESLDNFTTSDVSNDFINSTVSDVTQDFGDNLGLDINNDVLEKVADEVNGVPSIAENTVANNVVSDLVHENENLDVDNHQFDSEVFDYSNNSIQNNGESTEIPDLEPINNSSEGTSFDSNSNAAFDDIWKF